MDYSPNITNLGRGGEAFQLTGALVNVTKYKIAIWAKVVLFGQKVVVFGQKWLYLGNWLY